jgi:hypothetical protein
MARNDNRRHEVQRGRNGPSWRWRRLGHDAWQNVANDPSHATIATITSERGTRKSRILSHTVVTGAQHVRHKDRGHG